MEIDFETNTGAGPLSAGAKPIAALLDPERAAIAARIVSA
jgi:hypothetical protein